MPRDELGAFLEAIKPFGLKREIQPKESSTYVGIGLDACVLPTKFEGVKLVQTVDFFYPLIENPYWMGKIACANVLSDLYAMGVTDCDNMLMILGVSVDMDEQEKQVVVPQMMKGFVDTAVEGGLTSVNGGQTVKNPWMMIGGTATAVASEDDIVPPWNASAGDVMVLTKPLGTQVVVNAHQWMDQRTVSWPLIESHLTREEIETAYDQAVVQMASLNRNAALLMRKYGATACTDITGFGILGHATNLAAAQRQKVTFSIHTLPCLALASRVETLTNDKFKLIKGTSSETSGGLLVCLPSDKAALYIEELWLQHSTSCWIVGDVVEGNNTAVIVPNPTIIDV